MALELRQQLKLSQQLVMTPQLQQAIKLLQLSRLELMETVQQELLENPFLEESPESLVPADATEKAELRSEAQEGYDKELASNADWEDYLGDFSSTTKQVASRETEIPEEGSSFEARLSSRPSLDGHLFWQLTLSRVTERQQGIGEIIIGNIGSNGYLHASVQEMAEMAGAEVEEVEEMLHRVQRFDPVGVAARSPQECLLVQIEVLGYDRDPVLVELVRDHLEDLEKRRYKPLCRKFRICLLYTSDAADE